MAYTMLFFSLYPYASFFISISLLSFSLSHIHFSLYPCLSLCLYLSHFLFLSLSFSHADISNHLLTLQAVQDIHREAVTVQQQQRVAYNRLVAVAVVQYSTVTGTGPRTCSSEEQPTTERTGAGWCWSNQSVE